MKMDVCKDEPIYEEDNSKAHEENFINPVDFLDFTKVSLEIMFYCRSFLAFLKKYNYLKEKKN